MVLGDMCADILIPIFCLLDYEEIFRLRLTCRRFDTVILCHFASISSPREDMSDEFISLLLFNKVLDFESDKPDDDPDDNLNLFQGARRFLTNAGISYTDEHTRTICEALTASAKYNVVKQLNDRTLEFGLWYNELSLLLASWLGLEDCVRNCLDQGISSDLKDEHLATPLYAAALNDHESIARILIDYGTDIFQSVGTYATPLQFAAYRGSERIVRLLVGRYQAMNLNLSAVHGSCGLYGGPLGAAAAGGHGTIIRYLLVFAPGYSRLRNRFGRSALHIAVFKDRTHIVRFLLRSGLFWPLTRDRFDHTAADLAIARGNPSITRFFRPLVVSSDGSWTYAISNLHEED